jgi:hypothetical protein
MKETIVKKILEFLEQQPEGKWILKFHIFNYVKGWRFLSEEYIGRKCRLLADKEYWNRNRQEWEEKIEPPLEHKTIDRFAHYRLKKEVKEQLQQPLNWKNEEQRLKFENWQLEKDLISK